MKNIKKNSLIVLLITLFIFFIILKDDFNKIIDILLNIKVLWLILSIVIIFLYWFFKALSEYNLCKKYTSKITFHNILKQTIITEFFNGITPFSSGGQPMEIYMLKNCGISLAKSTNIVLQKSMTYQVALVIYGVLAILFNSVYKLFAKTQALKLLVVLGFLVNTAVCIFILIICFSRKVSKSILKISTKLGKKLKIIKDESNFINKYSGKINEFHSSAKIFIEDKPLFFTNIIINIVALTFFYSVPYFLIKGISIVNAISILEAITASAYVLLIGSFIPIPGGSGGIEYGFLQFFGTFVKNSTLSALVLMWRFITYYLGIIFGGIIFSFYKEGDVK